MLETPGTDFLKIILERDESLGLGFVFLESFHLTKKGENIARNPTSGSGGKVGLLKKRRCNKG